MSMTKRDYKLISEKIRPLKNNDAKAALIKTLCILLFEHNRRFDNNKFIRACYTNPDVVYNTPEE